MATTNSTDGGNGEGGTGAVELAATGADAAAPGGAHVTSTIKGGAAAPDAEVEGPWTWRSELDDLKQNAIPGVTVALVAVPLSIALAIASGCEPMMGLTTASFGCIVAGFLSGSEYNILGPAGALVNILASNTARFGVEVVPWLAIGAAILQTLVFALRLERYATHLPDSVLSGFTWGVAITIAATQLNFIFGLTVVGDKMCSGGACDIQHKHAKLFDNIGETFSNLGGARWETIVTFSVFCTSLFALKAWKPRAPWVAILSVVGIGLGALVNEGALSSAEGRIFTLQDKYGTLEPKVISFFYWDANADHDGDGVVGGTEGTASFIDIAVGSLSVAFVSVLETLISASIADARMGTRYRQDKEVGAVTASNYVAGLFGGMPCNGVIVRTTVNCMSGATSRRSQLVSGVCVLIIVGGMRILSYLPFAVISSILIVAVYGMSPVAASVHLWRLDKTEFSVMVAVTIISLVWDSFIGLLAGIVLSFVVAAGVAETQAATQITLVEVTPELLRAHHLVHHTSGRVHARLPEIVDVRDAVVALCRGVPPSVSGGGGDVTDTDAEALDAAAAAAATGAQDGGATIPSDGRERFQSFSHLGRLAERYPLLYEVVGTINYITAARVSVQLSLVPDDSRVVLSLRDVYHLDVDGCDAIGAALKSMAARGIESVIMGPPDAPLARALIHRCEWFQAVAADGKVHRSLRNSVAAFDTDDASSGSGRGDTDADAPGAADVAEVAVDVKLLEVTGATDGGAETKDD